MLRTRDFFLFIVIVLFLLIGVATTVMYENQEYVPPQELALLDGKEGAEGYAEFSNELDRAANIERLRQKIEQSETIIELQPSVSGEGDESDEGSAADSDASTEALVRCSAPDDALSIVPKWPVNEVTFGTNGLMREAFTETEVVVTTLEQNGSTSVPTETTQEQKTVLLSLPLVPAKSATSHCVPSEVVGISPRGLLIFNGDVRPYRSLSSDTLVGYARDGFPIYGAYDGEVDACGGYEHPSGYRYTLSQERDYILGCFAGTPRSFAEL